MALLDADPGFAAQIADGDEALARRVLTVPHVSAQRGAWLVPERATWRAPVTGLVLLEGAVARDVEVAGRIGTQFLGAGDIVQPWTAAGEGLPAAQRFTVHQRARFAVLDGRFALAASRWPGLIAVLTERLSEQVLRSSVHAALAQLPRVEQRVLAAMWALAERFGKVGPEGVVIDLRLTHAVLGQCVGARRPTVSLALRALMDDGLLARRDDGMWVLDRASTDALEGDLAQAPAAAAAG